MKRSISKPPPSSVSRKREPAVAPEPTRFIGREADLSAIGRVFAADTRLVTLIGAPGIGKTRLAKQYGERTLADRTVREVFFCDVSGARSTHQVLAALGAAIEVPFAAGATETEAARQLAHALAALSGALLIFDNFETVVEHAAATLGGWLTQAPGIQFLVTSRERLQLAGEACLEVEPLRGDDAADLFMDRARLVQHTFRCEGEDRDALHELLRRLDHNPLAIELAAARVVLLPPAELLSRISARLDLLQSRARDTIARHATLRAAIDWSWDLLPAAEREALAKCSVFEGGFTIEAAEAVLAMRGRRRAIESLDALLTRSLLRRYNTAKVRFGLYESIREYAAERLAMSGAASEAQARHAAYYLGEAERISAQALLPWVGGAVPALMLELDNLLAVFRQSLGRDPSLAARAALCLDPLLTMRGPADAHLAILEAASAEPLSDPVLEARLLRARGNAQRLLGRLAPARIALERAAALAREGGLLDLEALALKSLADVELDAGLTRSARSSAERLLSIARDPGAKLDRRIEGIALHVLGRVHLDAGELSGGLACAEAALSIIGALGPRVVEGHILNLLAEVYHRRGRLEEAELELLAALAIARELGDREFEATVLSNLAYVEIDRGLYDAAGARYAEGLALAERMGYQRMRGFLLSNTGGLAKLRGDLPVARRAYREALGIFREVGARRFEAITLMLRGALDLQEGRLEDAAGDSARAIEVAVELHQPALESLLRAFAVAVATACGRLVEAEEHLRVARSLAATADRPDLALGVEVMGSLVEIRRAQAAGGAALEEVARIKDWIAGARAAASTSLILREIVQIVDRVVERGLPPAPFASPVPAAPPAAALIVGPEARWFEIKGRGRVDLSRRGAMRRLILRLADHRRAAPDRSISLDELIDAGWPDSKGNRDSALQRLYTTLSMLRSLGVRDVLLRRDDGYLLDPSVPLVIPD